MVYTQPKADPNKCLAIKELGKYLNELGLIDDVTKQACADTPIEFIESRGVVMPQWQRELKSVAEIHQHASIDSALVAACSEYAVVTGEPAPPVMTRALRRHFDNVVKVTKQHLKSDFNNAADSLGKLAKFAKDSGCFDSDADQETFTDLNAKLAKIK